jgi:NADH dehydrogenase
MPRTNKKVVIIGGGFGGVNVAKNLPSFDVVLLNKENHFLFTPLLHEVATGNLSPTNIIEPLQAMFQNKKVQVLCTSAEKISLKDKAVYFRDSHSPINYDYLVLATGASSDDSIIGSKRFGYFLKTLNDANRLKNKILSLFKEASEIKDIESQKKLLRFVIIGGGATALEMVTELEEYICGALAEKYRDMISPDIISITLVSSGKEILKQFSPSIRESAVKNLDMKNIQVKYNSPVASIDKDFVTLSSSEKIYSSCTICLSGVKPEKPNTDDTLSVSKSGRIIVDEYQRLINYPEVYILGDVANFIQSEKPLPMLAQVATAQAKNVAKNILRTEQNRPLIKFIYKSKGELVSMGKFNASGVIMGISVNGVLAWFIWRTVYLLKFPSWKKRFKIMKEWTVNLFSGRDTLESPTTEK